MHFPGPCVMLMTFLLVDVYFVVDNDDGDDGDDYGDDDGYPANSYSQQFHRVGIVIMIKAGR